jgi:hypothetical protein
VASRPHGGPVVGVTRKWGECWRGCRREGGDTCRGAVTVSTRWLNAGVKVIRARADERAAKLAPIVKDIHAAGITSLNGIAEALNAPASQRPRVAGIGMRRRCCECPRGRYDRVPTPFVFNFAQTPKRQRAQSRNVGRGATESCHERCATLPDERVGQRPAPRPRLTKSC